VFDEKFFDKTEIREDLKAVDLPQSKSKRLRIMFLGENGIVIIDPSLNHYFQKIKLLANAML
jgi:hypothetical protein